MVTVPDAIRTVLIETCRQLLVQRSQEDHSTGSTGIPHSEIDYSSYYFEDIPLFHNSSANGHDAWKELQGRVLI